MASSTQDIRTQSATDNVAPPKINTINLDVFTMILQEVIEQEVEDHLSHPRSYKPKVAKTLSLVCKTWKNIVYSTPSFWPIIELRMSSSPDRMQTKLNVLATRARGAPVDLSILDINDNPFPDNENCCNGPGGAKIRLDFTELSNVRSLRVTFWTPSALHLFDPCVLPFLTRVKRAQFDIKIKSGPWRQILDLDGFLRHAPNLSYLRLNVVGIHNVSWALANKVLMPNLRTLEVDSGLFIPDSLPRLAQILSHVPNLEELKLLSEHYIVSPVPSQYLESVRAFHKLRKIEACGFTIVNWLFTDSGVKVPNLQEFSYTDSKNLRRDVERFWNTHRSIKKVHVKGEYEPSYYDSLRCAPDIEELTVGVGSQEGPWLSPLYTPRIDENTGLRSYICPNLRVVSVHDYDDCLLPSSFEKFVRIRCRPVSEDGYTVAGCRAIGLLRIQLSTRVGISEFLTTTMVWKEAKVWEVSYKQYELQWKYRPEQITLDTKAEGLDDKAKDKPVQMSMTS